LVAETATQAPELQTDNDLLRLVAGGSAEALASLYDRHAADVLALAARTTRDTGTARDVVQETFLALWNRAELFDPERGSLRGWLLAIARNRAIDHVRHARRHDRAVTFSALGTHDQDDGSLADWLMIAGAPVAAGSPDPGPEAVMVGTETRASMADAIASLPAAERSVITLAYGEHLTQVEIALELGWPLGTVKTRTRRALRHLRDRLVPATASATVTDGGSRSAGRNPSIDATAGCA
jgi:RNA polymerase sigma-70 factor, ECF subfamily